MPDVLVTAVDPKATFLRLVRRDGASIALQAGLVCALCFLATSFESAIVYPEAETAILFPPYAVLTAALLLSPVRHWWIYLLASALGNYFPHRQGFPATWVLLAEAANFSRALVAAVGIRTLLPDGPRFDTLRGVATFFVFAVVAGPFVAAFAGTVVVFQHSSAGNFWIIWQAWFFSNALTGLTMLPIALIGVNKAASWTRQIPWRRGLEFGALIVVLLAVGFLIFAGPYTGPSSLPARLYGPLPLLLLAAVRFGAGGTSASLLLLTVLSIWGALHGLGPFVTQAPAENLLSLQLFLLAVSVPLMFLAAVVQERQRTIVTLSESEQEVRRQYAQIAAIYRTAPVGLAFVDTQLRYVGISDHLAEIHGVPVEAHLGRTIREVVPDLADKIEPRYRLVLATGEPVTDVESKYQSPSGSERTWLVTWHPVRDAQGALIGVSKVMLETTERTEIEQLRQELAHASRLAILGELTASIAHEINQPLGAILTNVDAAELLLESSPASLDEVRQILADIHKDDLRASEVIRHLRGLLGHRAIEVQPVELSGVIGEVVCLVAAEARSRSVTLETAVADDLPLVLADKVQLQQVLLNLCLNGMEAMVDSAGAKRLSIYAGFNEKGEAEIAVCDTGPGISVDRLPRVFEPFFSTKDQGMGLGLSISRSLVERHGGRIWAENNPAGGSAFRFTLPAVRECADWQICSTEIAAAGARA
jgi:PAS domain S-box-containing protein